MDRLKVFRLIIFSLAALIIIRLFYWQFLSSFKQNSITQIEENEIPSTRGEILASDGFPLVTNQEAFLVYAKPREVLDPKSSAQKLAPFLISEKYATAEAELSPDQKKEKEEEIKLKENDLFQKLSSSNLFWVQLGRKIPLSVKQKIEALNLKGFGFEKDQKRLYTEASMAAQVLGFVGSDKFGKDTGYFGLEGYYDRKLRGKPGRLGSEKDPFGLPILIGKYKQVDPEKGSSILLTIDRSIQFKVEERLRLAVEKYGAKEGTVIVADPKTGNILAMSTFPAYNPSIWQEFNQTLFKNPAVADTYEPGSTFKLITMASALESKVITPQTKCDVCSGPRKIGGYEISTWNKKYYPDSSMVDVIVHSDNIGMTFVSEKLGKEKFYDYIKKFGFLGSTGIDLQEEADSAIRPQEQWRPIDLATASFGQGIAVTPIHMIQAVSAIANKGELISPKIVSKIVTPNGEEKIKVEKRQVISPQTASQITEMMVNAVEKGEAKAFAPTGYRIAGKTGTAQIPVEGHYDPNKTVASFIGFAPANDPKFVMLVRFTEPTSSPFGSETAAPTFFAIARDLFNYFSITPS